ncbi:MAG TPA: hypothetical protein VGK59_13340 [Ohtaekwangia sp.]
MDTQQSMRLLHRQIRDIQAQADKILDGDNSSENLENFSKYCAELKSFIKGQVQIVQIREFGNELPEIDYQRNEIRLWHYLILPVWWLGLYKDYIARNRTIQEVSIARSKFATLELMLKSV